MNNKVDLVELEYINNNISIGNVNDVDITTYNVLKLLRETNTVLLKNYGSILFWVLVNICLIFVTFVVVMFMPQTDYVTKITTSEIMFISFIGASTLLSYYLYFKVISEFRTNIQHVENQKAQSSWLSLVLNFLGLVLLVGCFLLICYGIFIEYSKIDAYLNGVNFTNDRVYLLEVAIFLIMLLLAVLYISVSRLLMKLVLFEVFAKGNNVLKAIKMVFKNILHNKNNVLIKIFIGSFIIEIISNIVFGILAWILDFFTLSSSIMLSGMIIVLIIAVCFIFYEFYFGTFVYLTYMSADVEE